MIKTVHALLDFLDLPWHILLEKFIDTNTHKKDKRFKTDDDMAYSTMRNSKRMAFEWRKHIENEDVSEVQKFCNKTMNIMGYNLMTKVPINRFDRKYPLLVEPRFKLTP